MATLLKIEQAMIERITNALPGRRVQGRLGNVRETVALETVVAPEIQVLLAQWEPRASAPGAGAWRWQVRIVEGAAPSPERRRLGRADAALPEGLFRTLEAVRATLTGATLAPGHAPLVPAGGALRTAGYPLMVWEEEFLDAPLVAGQARPYLGSEIRYACTVAEAVAPGTTSFALPAFNVPVEVGSYLLFESATRVWSEGLGAIVAIDGGVVTFERGPTRDLPVGTNVWSVSDAVGLATLPAAGSTREYHDGTVGETDLAGGAHRSLLRAPVYRRRDVHGPMPQHQARALLERFGFWRTVPRLLLVDAEGVAHGVRLDAAPLMRLSGNGMADLELAMIDQPLTSLAGFEVPDA